jgi:hypothetical protein
MYTYTAQTLVKAYKCPRPVVRSIMAGPIRDGTVVQLKDDLIVELLQHSKQA